MISVAGGTCPFSFLLPPSPQPPLPFSTLFSSKVLNRSKYLILGQYKEAGATEMNHLQITYLISLSQSLVRCLA